ncbi:MAG: HlyD family efflux transporter periplasmic adaptor subunit [Acidobacteriota bacterium]
MIRGTEATDRPIEQRTGRRRLGIALGALAVLALGVATVPAIERWASADRSVDASAVRTAVVVRGDLDREVSLEGRVVAAFAPSIFSPAPGIVRLTALPGQAVESGEVLAVVESPELSSRLAQERSSLAALESELSRRRLEAQQTELRRTQETQVREVRAAAAEREMARARRTFEEGVIGRSVYEQAKDDLDIARLELEHDRADARLDIERRELELRNHALAVERQRSVVADLKRQVSELEVRAPVDGLVARLDAADRDAVIRYQPLVTVVDLSALELAVDIPELWADEAIPGTLVEVRGPGGTLVTAELRSVAPEVTAGTVEGRVAFVGGPPEGLKQNQRLTARLQLDSRRGILKVRRGPFLETGGGHLAYVVDRDLAVRRTIETGAASVTEVEIRRGLEEGDEIIISRLDRFDDAEKVALR